MTSTVIFSEKKLQKKKRGEAEEEEKKENQIQQSIGQKASQKQNNKQTNKQQTTSNNEQSRTLDLISIKKKMAAESTQNESDRLKTLGNQCFAGKQYHQAV